MSGRAAAAAPTSLLFPPEHPAYAGHFPAAPVVPGVLLLDAALHAIESIGPPAQGKPPVTGAVRQRIAALKFYRPVKPGETLLLSVRPLPDGSVHFEWLIGTERIASGSLVRPDPLD
jgi:3-hydroxymyristoyl/3-hydroxydecanoyl-(acyl carrier protein) dehydratase